MTERTEGTERTPRAGHIGAAMDARQLATVVGAMLVATSVAAADGPFLQVTALEPAPSGIVFRVAWAHPYRPGGAHAPHAAGHLSKIYTPRTDPPPLPPAAVAPAEAESEALNTDALLDAIGDEEPLDAADDIQPLDDEPTPAKPEPETHGHGHHHAAPPRAPSLAFTDPAATWGDATPALQAGQRLQAGEPSHRLDLGAAGILPRSAPATVRAAASDQAMLLYIRAFAGEKLAPEPLTVQLDLFRNKDDAEPVASTRTVSGSFGAYLLAPNGDAPEFATDADIHRRWRERTEAILRNRGGKEYYIAPDGEPYADGTRESPWNLEAALRRTKYIRPGDTLWLLGGVYEAPGHRMPAPPSAAAPKESDAPPPKMDAAIAAAEAAEFDPLDSMLDEMIDPELEAKRKKAEADRFVTRHYFTFAFSGTADQPVIVRQVPGERAILRGGLQAKGAHTWFWGFELSEPPGRANSRRDSSHFDCRTTGGRLINLHLHGGDRGLQWSDNSRYDAEMYGCIIHDFGHPYERLPDGHHSHPQIGVGLSPLGAVRRLTDNVIFHGYGYNIQAPLWSEGVHGLVLEGNILFAAGTKQDDWSTANLVVNWHDPIVRMSLIDNVFHTPADRAVNVLSVGYTELMYTRSYELLLRGNVFDGGRCAATFGTWNSIRATNNVFRSRTLLANIRPLGFATDSGAWDRNRYVALRPSPTAEDDPPLFDFWAPRATYDDWLGVFKAFDRNSVFVGTPESLRAEPIVSVRPNLYEPGRAHVAVVGWGERQTAAVDLAAALTGGDAFSVYSVQDLERPLLESVFDGKPVDFPRTGSKLTPDFDAYLVLARPPKP